MTTNFTATSPSDFDSDIADINDGPDSAANTAYTIALSDGITVVGQALTLPSGASLEIDGPGFLVISAGDTLTVTGALTLDAPVTGDIQLDNGTLTIGAVTSSGGIQGGGIDSGGISGLTATDSVVNNGAVSTTESVAVHLTGGTVSNNGGATISGAEYGVVFDQGGTLVNGGSISGGGDGVYLSSGGTVNNDAAGAVISGAENGVVVLGAATVINGGTIEATTSDAVYVLSGTVTNGSVSDTTALIETAGFDAVEMDGAGTITNDGRIISFDVAGVYLGSGEVDNGLDASTALIQGAEFGVLVASGAGTVKNDGFILLSGMPSSQSGSEIGVALEDGGTVVNGAATATATTGAEIAGVDYGVAILGASGSVSNTGTITANLGTDGVGVDLEVGGTVVNGPAAGVGSITGTLFGVRVIGSGVTGSVTNAGTITGQVGVDFFDANGSAIGTLTDSGVIESSEGATGTAVRFGDGAERLVLQSGYSITGIVQGGTAAGDVTTLELAGGTIGAFTGVTGGNGAITGQFSFQNVTALVIDSGASWSFGGTESIASLQVGGDATVGGNLDVASLTDDTGGIQLSANGTLELGSATGHGNTITLTTGSTLKLDQAASFGAGQGMASYSGDTIAGFGQGKFVDLADVSYSTAVLQSYDAATGVAQISDGTHTADLTFASLPGPLSLHSDLNGGTLVESVACYCAGTRIATPGGEVAVEALRIGDAVLTADGRAEPVHWIGRRGYGGRFLAGRRHLLPIRFAAGSLGGGLPRRDLLVSPSHAMLLDGMLVPAEVLCGLPGITQVPALQQVTYFHIELRQHEAILAEGAASETFVDDDSRMLFHNASDYARLYPQQAAPAAPIWCAPRVTHGYGLEMVRRRLRAQCSEAA
jgi:hypothetical protein